MMLGLLPMSFRFRGKLGRLFDIHQCFREHPDKGLHPTQIARHTGISFAEVNARLEATPELFVKLPTRDGITRYRLTTATTARSPEEIEKFLTNQARRETLVLYAFGAMLLCLALIVVVLIGPAL